MRTIISHALAVLTLATLTVASAAAQTDYRGLSTNMLTVGVGFQPGGSVTLNPETGQKVTPVFAWRATAEATYPLNPTVSAMFGLGLDSRGTGKHPQNDGDAVTEFRVTYLTLMPAFKLSSFMLGFNIGIPLGGTVTKPVGESSDMKDETLETYLSSASGNMWDKVAVLLEPRLGAVIPILDDPTGWLGLTLGAGYSLNRLIDVEGETGLDNMFSGHIGVTYQFGIKGTGRGR